MTELNVQLVQHVDLFKGQLLLLCKFSLNIPEGERERKTKIELIQLMSFLTA